MGAYLVGGVVTRFEIRNKGNYDVVKNQDEVLKSLDEVIDTSIYNVEEYLDGIELVIKKEVFEDNIHNLIKEISPIMNTRIYFFANLYKGEINIKNFNKENYPISLNIYPKGTAYEDKFYLNDGEIREKECYPDYSYMLLRDDESGIMHNLKINMKLINIWLDPTRIDEYPLGTINVLNKLTSKCFKNVLAKSIFFYVD